MLNVFYLSSLFFDRSDNQNGHHDLWMTEICLASLFIVGMIINSWHKLCLAFNQLLKARNTLKLCLLYTAKDACLPHHPCPCGGSILGPTDPEANALPLSRGPPLQPPNGFWWNFDREQVLSVLYHYQVSVFRPIRQQRWWLIVLRCTIWGPFRSFSLLSTWKYLYCPSAYPSVCPLSCSVIPVSKV